MTTELKGVGGWLKFAAINLIFITPFLNFSRAYGSLSAAEATRPGLADMPEWQTYRLIGTIDLVLNISLCVCMGLALYNSTRRSVKWWVIGGTWVAGPLLNSATLFATHAAIGEFLDLDPMVGTIIGSAVMAAVWTAYFLLSRRVANTYVD